ncbi:Non-specific serine/threonine protein kinase [Plasmodiophora brassicae]
MPSHRQCIVLRAIVFVAIASLARSRPEPASGFTQPVQDECQKEDFEELGVIGVGTTCVVFLARRHSTGKLVAVKRVPKATIQQSPSLPRELPLLKSLRGIPFVVHFHCSIDDAQYLYLVMEFCQGGELFEVIANKGRLEEPAAKFYAASIVLALEQMHERGIIYRDLKPQNILLTGTGHVRLADVGLSKELAMGQRTNSFVGTPEYLAPEMLSNRPDYAHPVDWWALGAVIYEMLFGKRAFEYQDQDGPTQWEQVINRGVRIGKDVHVSIDARRIVRGLLHPTPGLRLGFRGAHEVKRHAWFADVDWDALADGELPPPFLPPVSDPLDRSCFDFGWIRENLDDADNEPLFKDF